MVESSDELIMEFTDKYGYNRSDEDEDDDDGGDAATPPATGNHNVQRTQAAQNPSPS
jgi:hypothetical protein